MNTATFLGPPWKKRNATEQAGMYVLLMLPALGTAIVAWLTWLWGFDWHFPVMAFVLYALTALGITVGYHRHFTHESFLTYQWVRAVFGAFGEMAGQGKIIDWCTKHGTHHKRSDVPGADPHTPLEYRGTPRGFWKGFWHAHFGWLLYEQPLEQNDVWKRLHDDPLVCWLDEHSLFWFVMGFIIPTTLGYIYTDTWQGALLGLLWGGGVRLFVVQHVTWAVNSVCHVWGKQPFGFKDKARNDDSRDNWLVALLAFGEGWHNFHHLFMKSALHGYDQPWFDPSYILIKTLKVVGLAWSVHVPKPETVNAYRIMP